MPVSSTYCVGPAFQLHTSASCPAARHMDIEQGVDACCATIICLPEIESQSDLFQSQLCFVMSTSAAVTHGFRASCERCRSQKLRCIPSSDTDTGAPCQRCARSKSAKSCVFSQRSRVGRGKAKASPRIRETNKPSHGTPLSSPKPHRPLHTNNASPNPSSEVAVDSVMGASLDALWNQDVFEFDSLYLSSSAQTSSQEMSFSTLCSNYSHAGESATSDKGIDEADDFGHQPDMQDLEFSSAGHNELTLQLDVPPAMEDGGELEGLSTLVAELFPYEKYISNSTKMDLQDYPIGDVISFSHRLSELVSTGSETEDFSHPHMPTTLLALSCYLTLTRTCLSVFTYLHNHLSQQMNEQHQHRPQDESSMTPRCLMQEKANTFRGLRLHQLQLRCLCASWSPIKKAVVLLISALTSIENSLELPQDIRLITPSRNDLKTNEVRVRGRRESSGSKSSLGETLIFALTKGQAFKTFRSQSRELRARVGDVEELLSL